MHRVALVALSQISRSRRRDIPNSARARRERIARHSAAPGTAFRRAHRTRRLTRMLAPRCSQFGRFVVEVERGLAARGDDAMFGLVAEDLTSAHPVLDPGQDCRGCRQAPCVEKIIGIAHMEVRNPHPHDRIRREDRSQRELTPFGDRHSGVGAHSPAAQARVVIIGFVWPGVIDDNAPIGAVHGSGGSKARNCWLCFLI